MIQMEPINYSRQAIEAVNKGKRAYCKFLAANDTGLTGGHQSGIYIAKNAVSILFDTPCVRGENKKKNIKIKWQDDFTTESVITYYGQGSRNEYRITKFGRGFELLNYEHTGDLFVLVQWDTQDYSAYVLSQEDDINAFLDYYGMSPAETNNLITSVRTDEQRKNDIFKEFVSGLTEFPVSEIMSEEARNIYEAVYDHEENIWNKPDEQLLAWINMEYELFRNIEDKFFGSYIKNGFPTMQDFIEIANSVLNRRKSRAGKSLEHQLSYLFTRNHLVFDEQVRTEQNKKPDFVFPGKEAYHDLSYDANKLIVLGAKTTCKDRWRQVVTEADRVDVKYLCTLQQGITVQQLKEMQSERVVLVVPRPYIRAYPPEFRDSIFDLKTFMQFVREKTE